MSARRGRGARRGSCSPASGSRAARGRAARHLSGGQQQRVAIARAFAARPRALLLDEVTSALDPELVGEVLRAVRDLKEEGMTMLIATHEMSFAREVADQVGFLHEGRIVEVGPPEQVLESPQRPEDPALPAPPARGRPRLTWVISTLYSAVRMTHVRARWRCTEWTTGGWT